MVAPRELNESLQKISAILALLRSDLLELAEAKAPAQRIPVMAHLDWIADQFDELGAELTDGHPSQRTRAKTDARHRMASPGSASPRHRPSQNAVRPSAARHSAKPHAAETRATKGAASKGQASKGHATRHNVAAAHRSKPHSEAGDTRPSARDLKSDTNLDAKPENASASDMERAPIAATPSDPKPQATAPEASNVGSAADTQKPSGDGSAE